ncbi:MAG: hypothetical protein H7A45_11680 [Verrucomicrobiales bacterium]|nr:hypothetical protein [Verrucomicrobiales bacterium]MCP5525974.1 hypothetical protein [Verrucomicrobiales bacterium]
MKTALKILAYVLLLALGALCVKHFLGAYQERMDRAGQRFDRWDSGPEGAIEQPAPGVAETAAPAGEGTNETGAVTVTNEVANAVGDTNRPAAGAASTAPVRAAEQGEDSLGLYAAGGFVALLGLALLAAYDISHFVERRANRLLAADSVPDTTDRAYEEAERLWANGDHLGAVHALRDYLQRYPRRVHAHFRIAEIYEKDLGNPLAAALEHEEILKFRLDPERWGWAAVHLCNLYYHLNQAAKAEVLLRRIVTEYGQTQAARKARKRLGLPEDAAEETSGETPEAAAEETTDDGGFRLPPGFRPKK